MLTLNGAILDSLLWFKLLPFMKVSSFVILVKAIEDPVRFYVEKLFSSFGGIGTNEDNINRIIISRSEVRTSSANSKMLLYLMFWNHSHNLFLYWIFRLIWGTSRLNFRNEIKSLSPPCWKQISLATVKICYWPFWEIVKRLISMCIKQHWPSYKSHVILASESLFLFFKTL